MSDADFDSALIAAAFRLAARDGWTRVSVVAACREAGLPLTEARTRFPTRGHILVRFGQMADQFALTDAPDEGPVRDRLFDLLMRRFDALNAQRDGIKALMRALPLDPPTALLLNCATRTSMRWLLQAAGVPAAGLRGDLLVKGLVAVWLWGLRTWERDDTEDLTQTMAAVDQALGRAEWFARLLTGGGRDTGAEETAASEAEDAGEGEEPDAVDGDGADDAAEESDAPYEPDPE